MNILRTFDIETGPLPTEDIMDLLPAPKLGNRKDPEVIAEYRKEHEEKSLEEAAKSPITGRVLSFGCKDSDGGQVHLSMEEDEAELLKTGWRLLFEERADHRLPVICGFNIYKFDFHFMIWRSIFLNVGIPNYVRTANGYFLRRSFDMIKEWQMGDYMRSGNLDRMLKACGLSGKAGNGADFARMYHEDRPAAIHYATTDIIQEEALALRMGVQWKSF